MAVVLNFDDQPDLGDLASAPVCPFFFNDPATTEIYTLSLHDALPISPPRSSPKRSPPHPPRFCPDTETCSSSAAPDPEHKPAALPGSRSPPGGTCNSPASGRSTLCLAKLPFRYPPPASAPSRKEPSTRSLSRSESACRSEE